MPPRKSMGRIWGFFLDGVRFISGSASPAGLLFPSLLFGIFLLKWYLHADIHMRVREHFAHVGETCSMVLESTEIFYKRKKKNEREENGIFLTSPAGGFFWWLKTLLPKEIIS